MLLLPLFIILYLLSSYYAELLNNTMRDYLLSLKINIQNVL